MVIYLPQTFGPAGLAGSGVEPDAPLVVVTLNLWRMRGNWRRRRELVLAELRRLEPDVVALQEVAPFRGQARSLARGLAGGGRSYRAFVARKRGWRGLIEGIGLLTRLDVEAYDARALGGVRVAQRLTVRTAGGRALAVFNAHMESGGAASELRHQQTAALAAWAAGAGAAAVVAGDFNARPGSHSLEPLAETGFRSAHMAVHGAEPAWTAPAGPPGTAGSTLDYIFVGPAVRVLACERAFTEPSRGVYPSDHFGLAARLAVER